MSSLFTDSNNVLLAPYTTFQVGGKASVFREAPNLHDLIETVAQMQQQGDAFFILGGGSNVLVSDEGIEKILISTRNLDFMRVAKNSDNEVLLYTECGCSIQAIMTFCVAEVLSGLENFAGLPGTIGGALFMNARCYEQSLSDIVASVEYVRNGTVGTYHFFEGDWDYKKSPFQAGACLAGACIVSACLRVSALEKTDKMRETIARKNAFYIADRTEKGHFRFPSAGSVFKNNRAFGKPSGKIIAEAGLRSYSIGGAQIAPWHGNFIINTGNACAKDIRDLISYIIETVHEKTGFTLEPEIVFV